MQVLVLADSHYLRFPSDLGNPETNVRRWSGERLALRSQGCAARDAFCTQVPPLPLLIRSHSCGPRTAPSQAFSLLTTLAHPPIHGLLFSITKAPLLRAVAGAWTSSSLTTLQDFTSCWRNSDGRCFRGL